jgi:prepilin-type N-terminal cleavage/methylation domain-containing protein/prepilin-type processing-associated H-X9-DG protein
MPQVRPSPQVRPHHHAFTLIELLVVVAIIATLASLLLPAITTASSMAKSTQCLSGERQVGMAFLAYAADYRDAIVPTNACPNFSTNPSYPAYVNQPSTFSGFEVHWYIMLGPYVDSIHTATDNQYKRGVFWTCPTFRGRRDIAQAANGDKTGFGRNPCLEAPTPGSWTTDDQKNAAPVLALDPVNNQYWCRIRQYRFSKVTHPSNRVLIGDSDDWGLGVDNNNVGVFSGWPSQQSTFAWGNPVRHRGRANYLMCDGSVASLDPIKAWYGIANPSATP